MELDVLNPTIVTGIHLTEAAASRVKNLIAERNLEGYALRIYVSGGGCSGYQYGMGLDDNMREDDLRFDFNGIQVIVDPQSMDYMQGATVDYVNDLMGGGFKVENPQAVASCGCGHSFKTAEEAAPESASSGACC
ncbi:MAG: iron-sulfur cluster insertion protein ErpA [Chloroflexi bacterium]|nr:iron-sulfur cluster insertion protein ErpA [Chloroflexota bacterium]